MISSKGHLNPGAAGVRLDRFAPPAGTEDVVRHLWRVRWSLPDGAVQRQRVLSYPASNVVFGPDGAVLSGLGTAVATRDLDGESWALGLLLRPAVTRLFSAEAVSAELSSAGPPAALVGRVVPLHGAPVAAVRAVMEGDDAGPAPLHAALAEWLAPFAARVDERMRLCNEVCRLAEEDPDMLRVDELARAAGLPVRSLDRLVKEHVGVTPKWLIDCRRLQEAATVLYGDATASLPDLAHRLGFSDQAHFSRSYRKVIGETPAQTRAAGERARSAGNVPPRLR
ncbi:helix-turn-helix domain-containing protein [Arthrobacter woluwensis]|uniref:AraC-type DNA-binding protein n=1 Tax=Arthrobacter woluwensis TaxID=156980 RepID=A0A1H4VU25_9MICC|nr:helix-turn-helix domain-containing protein [Arthrobacter woluwensis]SEC84577.1 AraC-type DNA-binding protein [Arthrobacter woluwensis]